jgi:hypothetical protein
MLLVQRHLPIQLFRLSALGAFLTPTTRIATANVGLPYNVVQIPVVGNAGIVGTSNTPYFWVNNLGQPIYFTNNSGSILYWSFP